MKRLLFLPLILVCFTIVHGQETYDSLAVDSIATPKRLKLRGYAFIFKDFSTIRNPDSDQTASINANGLGIAGIINDRYILGVFSSFYFDETYTQRVVFPNEFSMNYIHAGGWFGYRFKTDKFYNLLIENKVSFGHVRWKNVFTGVDFLDSEMMIVQPTLSVDIDPVKFFTKKRIKPDRLDLIRLNFNIGYRYMTGLNIAGLKNDDFNGVNIGVMLKVGYFK